MADARTIERRPFIAASESSHSPIEHNLAAGAVLSPIPVVPPVISARLPFTLSIVDFSPSQDYIVPDA
jgi:hypothetical protein